MSVPIEWRSEKTISRPIFVVCNRKVEGKMHWLLQKFGKLPDGLLNVDFLGLI